jgi:carnosine synthase
MGQIPSGALKGKTIAIIGIGGKRKIHYYRVIRSWGVHVVIVCSELEQSEHSSYADSVIVIDGLYEHHNDTHNSERIVDAITTQQLKPDGVLTLWEDCGPLAAKVATALALPGLNPQTASIAKSKYETYDALAHPSHRSSSQNLHVKTLRCGSILELRGAISQIGLPAILKLERGSSAAAVVPVYTAKDAEGTWRRIKHTLRSEADWPGIGLGFGSDIILSELLEGTEHDVDIVVWEGRPIGSFVTDNGPTRTLSCAESTALMPSVASQRIQSEIVDAASEACYRLGMTSGVFNIELINTANGPKVIDVNARMGGFYIRDWILKIWGYDILLASVQCCLGIMPEEAPLRYEKYIAGVMLSPSVHGSWLSEPDNMRNLQNAAATREAILVEFEDAVYSHELVDEPWGNLAVVKHTAPEAIASLTDLCNALGLTQEDPELDDLLSWFLDQMGGR